ncbi:zinc finger matrin-type protein 3 [Drosophila eugracilis]|uniref:zinc finger matrin-type protein 3 n=1 Tax=Drosophila eugracilis TaxID=29029 RepID=UPI0007E692E3|nr:zinc finger matrin-type protein 3 [Drosophila eugracilis]
MSSSGFLTDFHIPHLPPGATPNAPMDIDRDESPPALAISAGNRLVAPGKQTGKSDPGSIKPKKRKAERIEEISLEADGKLGLFPGRDESYPEELNRLIGPLNCELCKAQMTSRKCARDHYESKAHDRHISDWLAKNYTEAGLKPPAVKRPAKGPTGPSAFHCDLCDLDLNSSKHARQHYLGRKHKLVEQRISKPSGSGHYDESGKWVRAGSKVEGGGVNSSDGRYGIGIEFTKTESSTKEAPKEEVPQKVLIKSDDKQRTCTLCNIVVTSAPQMQMHVAGARHQKNMRNAVQDPPGDVSLPEAPLPVAEKLTAEELALYRTPIGQYYCKPCNMIMNHVTTLQQHLVGKKHLKAIKNYPQDEKSV